MTATEEAGLVETAQERTAPLPLLREEPAEPAEPAPPPIPAAAPAPVAIAVPAVDDLPRNLPRRSFDDVWAYLGSAVAAFAFTWVVYWHVLEFSGYVGFTLLTWAVYLVFLAGITLMANPVPVLWDRLASAVVQSGAAVLGALVVGVAAYVYVKGWHAYTHWNFFSQDMSGVRPTDPLTHGGIKHAIVGSAEEVGLATAISLPLGFGTAIYLTEVGGAIAQVVRTVVEAMTALPDILAGLFVYTFLIIRLHWEQDGLTVAVALAVTMVPIVARSAEVMLRVVPSGLREAGLALGASRGRVVWSVVLPTARANLVTSVILGIARVAGETAPLLIVSKATIFYNSDPFHDSQNSLPLFIYFAIKSGETTAEQRAYGAAAVLLTLVLVLFVAARLIARDRRARGR